MLFRGGENLSQAAQTLLAGRRLTVYVKTSPSQFEGNTQVFRNTSRPEVVASQVSRDRSGRSWENVRECYTLLFEVQDVR